jgi:hypothetical protein
MPDNIADKHADKHAKAAELDAAIKDGAKRKAEHAQALDKLLDAMTGLTSGMRAFQLRLDALESKHLEGHGGPRQRNLVTGEPPGRSPLSNGPADSNAPVRSPFSTGDDHGKAPEPGEPRPTVADAADPNDPNDAIFGRGRKFQGDFYQRQADADTACRSWGAAAVPPLHGEQLLDYRKRLLRPLQKYSTQFKDVDLDELREPLLTPIEKSIFADAIKASTDNASAAPDGYLREVTTVDATGRRITSFYGQPRVWLNQFAGQRRRLIGIRTTSSP